MNIDDLAAEYMYEQDMLEAEETLGIPSTEEANSYMASIWEEEDNQKAYQRKLEEEKRDF